MPELHVPEKRQRITPPLTIVMALVGLVLAMAAIWLAVGLATSGGETECPAQQNQTGSNCR